MSTNPLDNTWRQTHDATDPDTQAPRTPTSRVGARPADTARPRVSRTGAPRAAWEAAGHESPARRALDHRDSLRQHPPAGAHARSGGAVDLRPLPLWRSARGGEGRLWSAARGRGAGRALGWATAWLGDRGCRGTTIRTIPI